MLRAHSIQAGKEDDHIQVEEDMQLHCDEVVQHMGRSCGQKVGLVPWVEP